MCCQYYLQYSLVASIAAGGLSNKLATSDKAAAPTTLSSWVSMMPGAQALADSMEQDEPVMPGGLNLVVMGPPLAGKSTQAQMLADRYQLVAITIDELLMVSSMKHSLLQLEGVEPRLPETICTGNCIESHLQGTLTSRTCSTFML